MREASGKILRKSLGLVLFALLSVPAFADGGQIILHGISGSMEITVFAAPAPLTTGQADLSILIQDSRTREPILDVTPALSLQPPYGAPMSLRPDRSSMRLMQSARVNFAQPGLWAISVTTSSGESQNVCSARFSIALSQSRTAIVWFAVLLPLFVIALFVLHQRESRR